MVHYIRPHHASGVILILLFLILSACSSQKEIAGTSTQKDEKSIEKIVKSCKKHQGLFTLYQDTAKGKLYMQISKDQLNKEFIHFSQIINGPVEAGFHRGAYRGSRIFEIRRYFNEIQFEIKNTRYYFDSNSNLSRASEANLNEPLIFSSEIKANNDSSFLIEVDKLFLSESFYRIKNNRRGPIKLGKLNAGMSHYKGIYNYPKNTDIAVNLVYQDDYPKTGSTSPIVDSRSISISLRHSLVELPDNDYQPRKSDPRVGFFMVYRDNMTTTDILNYDDFICRWNLVKKNPEAKLSEPVTPITYWLENTTPKELIPVVKNGVLAWNKAFEKIGFKNAVEVKVQPDTATWDAGDIRYNVIRWTSSPYPPFGGYGPSFTNPRTGEILGADIMLEFVYLTNRLRSETYYERAASSEDFDEFSEEDHFCSFGEELHLQNLSAHQFLQLEGLQEEQLDTFIKQSIYRLVLHEVGHTLGLAHNFKGSLAYSTSELESGDFNAVASTVMEYPSINYSPVIEKNQKHLYYDIQPGVYDDFAIEYGYSTVSNDAEEEQKRLEKILSKANTNSKLSFANDAEAMRSPGSGIDPGAMVFDLSSEPLVWAKKRIELINSLKAKLPAKYESGEYSRTELHQGINILNGNLYTVCNIVSRYVGGVHTSRNHEQKEAAYEPVSVEDQKEAMNLLSNYFFAESAFLTDASVYEQIRPKMRGWNRNLINEPKIVQTVQRYHESVLKHFLHPNTLARIQNSKYLGNSYDLNEVLSDLTEAVWKDVDDNSITKQNLIINYLDQLIEVYTDHKKQLPMSKAAAFNQIELIEKKAKSLPSSGNLGALKSYLLLTVDQTKNNKANK